ncbi:flagellin [Vulcaniibacterium thermophilum]|uniref:Flagellin n=1 Tax=Vulcaniibacterium thermophilum TaxID=1169913 RepID=A0A918Z4F8_9GAMM|nr:flagellin [Vulcaniibacterium thermophilum]GHE37393.1 flagellin [Vulcaniibacterium thermophilum]
MQVINTNVMSLNAQRNLASNNVNLATSIQRLSSGLRVNSAKDDAAGLAIAERMNAQVRGMNVAIRNANDAISLAQTAEGALGKIGDALQRMRELAVQSANATNSSSDRTSLDAEFAQLQSEITRLVDGTTFNGTALFTGSSAFSFQVGAGTTSNDTVSVTRNQLSGGTAAASGSLTASSATDVVIATVTSNSDIAASATAAQNAIEDIDIALDKINSERANYGAAQNRFQSIISNLQISAENVTAARSRIMDADFAKETAELTRTQILAQAGTAMLAQANQVPQSVLGLLR